MTLDNSTPQIIDSILYFTENRKLVMLDEETLVATSGGAQQRIRLYKSNVFQAVPYEKNQITEPEQFVVMPNGILIASHGRYDGIVFYDIWDVKKLKEFSAHSSVLTADFMPNGHLLLEDRHGVVIVGANGPVRYFQDKDISHDKWPCLSHTFSFYDYWNDTLEVYDSNTFKHIVDIKSLNGYPPEVSIDGKYYKERGDSTIYDIYTQKIAEKVPPDICFNPQKCKLPKIIEKVTNYEYDYFLKPPGSTKEILLEEPGFQIRIITGHPFAVDAKMTKIAVEAITRDPIRKTAILVFDIQTGRKLYRIDLPFFNPDLRSMFFTPNPDIIGFTALSAGSSMIQLWNVKTNRKAADLFFPLDNPYDFIIYTPDGRIDGSEQALEYRYHLEVNGKVIPKEGVLKITPGLLFQIVQEKK